LNKISYGWDRKKFIEKGGWAIMPCSEKADATVAKACAETLRQFLRADSCGVTLPSFFAARATHYARVRRGREFR
jgi:hypothetical protein